MARFNVALQTCSQERPTGDNDMSRKPMKALTVDGNAPGAMDKWLATFKSGQGAPSSAPSVDISYGETPAGTTNTSEDASNTDQLWARINSTLNAHLQLQASTAGRVQKLQEQEAHRRSQSPMAMQHSGHGVPMMFPSGGTQGSSHILPDGSRQFPAQSPLRQVSRNPQDRRSPSATMARDRSGDPRMMGGSLSTMGGGSLSSPPGAGGSTQFNANGCSSPTDSSTIGGAGGSLQGELLRQQSGDAPGVSPLFNNRATMSPMQQPGGRGPPQNAWARAASPGLQPDYMNNMSVSSIPNPEHGSMTLGQPMGAPLRSNSSQKQWPSGGSPRVANRMASLPVGPQLRQRSPAQGVQDFMIQAGSHSRLDRGFARSSDPAARS